MSDKECICPVVIIKAEKQSHVTIEQMRVIANKLRATVTRRTKQSEETTFGKHRDDCPARGER